MSGVTLSKVLLLSESSLPYPVSRDSNSHLVDLTKPMEAMNVKVLPLNERDNIVDN